MPEKSNGGYEQDLNNIVVEYLDYANYGDTLEAFKGECVTKGRPIPQTSGIKSDQKKHDIQRDLLSLFHSGSRREFFILWNESLPQVTRDKDQLCQKLEFYLQIYFAIYYYKYPTPVSESSTKIEEATTAFRTFLETRGAVLSQTTEFLPYYALPFVPNPPAHPSFKELFTDSWVPDVQVRLEKFLSISLRTNANPRLLELYKDGSKDVQLQLSQYQQSLVESERKTTKYMKRYSKLQNDYHNIISITAELVDTLEATFNGTMVTPEYLQSVCARLFSNQSGQSVDFTRPGTAGSVIRKSLVASSLQNMPENPQSLLNLDEPWETAPDQLNFNEKEGTATNRSVLSPPCIKQQDGKAADTKQQPGAISQPAVEHPEVVLYPALDYPLVKEDITYAENREKCLLLQALRWRLTKSVAGEQRDDVVSSYISNDLLACRMSPTIQQPTSKAMTNGNSQHESETYRAAIFQLLKSGTMSAQYLARLINGIASIRSGRSYLSESEELLNEMQVAMQAEPRDNLTREMLLGSLQKLSLKRSLQTVMIKSGLIEWLVEELTDFDSLSDYSLEYSVALLMNLCLRTRGKIRCSGFPSKILSVLSDLLGHDYHDIRPYINGTLYSILCVPEVKHEAKSMGLEDIMKQYKSADSAEMNRQIDFIIRQLNSEEKPKDPDESGDEEEDEEEEDEGDAMEADLDKDEIIRAAGSELSGEKLLTTKYLSPAVKQSLLPPKSAASKSRQLDASEPLMRPTTPSRTHIPKSAGVGDNNSAIGSEEVSRPPTRSGVPDEDMDLPVLREESSESVKTDAEASEVLSRTLGMDDKKVVRTARSQSGVTPSRQALDKLENIDFNEYSMVFGSRPKIVRTPDVGDGQHRRTNTAPMTPKVSTSVPKWSQRPTSGANSLPGGNSTSRN
ncbi:lisH domain-containing protein ARMC9-like isoform X2 [Convolutriloba macropyga]|uniref:lisH domain-containing protein ARMC9-like isoform X2 n=1 Tax=Convolutriloba macropyga TaxID=536237 RepID=UPI003F521F6F